MAHSGPDARARGPDGWHPERVARASRSLGLALLGAAGPALLVPFLVAVTRDGVAPVAWVQRAMATPLLAGGGAAWAFHIAALTGLVGVWVVGFGLVVEGYYGVE